jgi:hypothetical protein
MDKNKKKLPEKARATNRNTLKMLVATAIPFSKDKSKSFKS